MPLPDKKHYTADEFFAMFPKESSSELLELIEGEIYNMASPSELHQDITGGLYAEIRAFIKQNQGKCKVMIAPFDVKLSEDTIVIPDVSVICDPSKRDGKRCNGAPDWVIEVTSSNRSDDLITKYALYQKYGVREYWIVDPKYQKTLVYYFEKSDLPNIYTFDTPIPVEIYDRNLSVTIAELL